jgi:hypothetical protein
MANPFSSQLSSFSAGVPNARKGLVDLYKLRGKGRKSAAKNIGALYGDAGKTSATSTKHGLADVAAGAAAGFGLVQSNGYSLDPGQTSQLKGTVQRGAAPFSTLVSSAGGAQAGLLKGFGSAAVGEQKALGGALPREQSAAMSELEQGIVGAQTGLAAQAADFASQQSFVDQQTRYYTSLAAQAGLQGGQPGGAGPQTSSAENWIIQHESSGRVTADNPRSTAYGLGQLLYSNRVKYGRVLGVDPNTQDYNSQLAMMRLYIKDRYGSAQAAMQFWQQNGWY